MTGEDIRATIGINIFGTRELNTLIKYVAMLQDGVSLSGRQLATFERLLVKVQRGALANVKTTQKQAEAVNTLTASLTKLGIAQAATQKSSSSTGFATDKLAARVALINQQAKETEKAAAAQAKFNEYARASTGRQGALEDKDRAATQKAVNAEIKAEAAARKVAAAATAEQAAKQKSLNDYIKASNARQQASEQAALAQTKRAVTKEIEAQNQVSKAQVQYAAQAGRANVQYGQSLDHSTQGLANQRYALYDVATTLGVVSTATLGVSLAVEGVGISFEKNFASVERTSGLAGAQLENLRSQLVGISTTMPVAFQDVTQIATLGSQLGIANDQLDSFTNTISQFSATTDVSVDQAAQSFGRLGQLTQTPANEFANLGSAIYQVGITSVATESQILAVAQQIAVAGNLAGFSADQTIALAGALASLGVQPEAARGSIARIFNIIETATQEGGASLDEFARISGTTAENFAKQWSTDPSFAFRMFVDGLGEASDRGEFLSGVLADLGLNAVRDQNALKLLADNTEVYNQALRTSAGAYSDGTALANGYQVVADTLSAKLQVLAQTLQAIADSASNLGIVKTGVEMLQQLADALQQFVGTNVGKVLSVVALGLLTLTGLIAGYLAAQALATASAYALRTAMSSLTVESGRNAIGIRALATELGVLSVGAKGATAALKTLGSTTLVGLGLTVALTVLPDMINEISMAFKSASEKAEAYFGDLQGLTDALKADTANGGEGFRKITSEVETSNTQLAPWAKNLQVASGAQVALNDATSATTKSVQDQTVIVGENAKAWLANAIANDQAFQQYYMKNAAALKQAGFDLQTFLNATLNTEGGGTAYLKTMITDLESTSNGLLDASVAAGGFDESLQNQLGTALQSTSALNGLLDVAEASDGAFQTAAEKAQFVADVNRALGISAEITSDGLDDEATSLSDIVDSASSAAFSLSDANSAVFNLGKSLQENGNSFSAYSESGRANLSNLQSTISALTTAAGGDSTRLAVLLQGLMQSLASYGVNTVKDLAFVQAAIAKLTHGSGLGFVPLKDTALAAATAGDLLGQGFRSGAGGVKKAGGAAKKATAEIRTLTDYVNDLSNVFKSSFEIRFGLEQSLDAVAEGWQKMTDSAEDASEAVQDAVQELVKADATIGSLKAANTTLEYQLTVAQQYGDVLRASEILAEIADNNADIADEQKKRTKTEKDLAKAQAAAIPSLDGQTEGSRKQRDMVLSLVKSYQDQVVALANSGLSQQEVARRTQELKNQFISQLTQMGYNRAEVDRYAASFDDLTLAIEKVPRNITVTANVDPAQRAIDEFLARNANKTVSTSVGVSGDGYAAGVANGEAYARGYVAAVNAGRRIVTAVDNNVPGGRVYRTVDAYGNYGPIFFNKGGLVPEYHASGGGAGHPGGPKGTDTIPAWLSPDEYVVQRSAVRAVGLPFMNALNNQQIPKYLATGGAASASSFSTPYGPTLVELMPSQLQQLASLLSTTLSLDGKIITEKVNNDNLVSARRGSN